jgi:HPt (histidine-containing phosphotransfer) domain-containing protein
VLRPDWHLLEELSFGKPAFILRMIDAFLRESPPVLARLRDAVSVVDLTALTVSAHQLRGQVAYFGVPVLHTALTSLEQQARAGHNAPEAEVCRIAELFDSLLLQVMEHRTILAAANG